MSQKPPIEEKPMSQLSSMTPAQLNAMTKAQLIARIVEGVTETTPVATRLPDGRLLSIEETTKDAYGTVLGSRVVAYTYYPSGEVNEIGVVEMDAASKVLNGYNVKHYTDGRQPEMLALEDGEDAELVLGGPSIGG